MIGRRQRNNIMFAGYLKRSQFLRGMVNATRGLTRDMRVLVWLVKRNGRIGDYLRTHTVRKLQLATSNNLIAGWLNTDLFLNHGAVVYLDATKRFPFEDNTFDYIMSEHMIEHIEYQAAQTMLRECFRVLKPGGRVRIATPDLQVLLALHSREKTEVQTHYIDWAVSRFTPEARECKDVFVINNFFHAWGHCFIYDQETLQYALHASGFHEVAFYKPGESDDPMLRNLECHGRELGSEEINRFETIVAEGHKAQSDPVSPEKRLLARASEESRSSLAAHLFGSIQPGRHLPQY
jgi:predicted SAM-dependent methyltransferase